MPKPGMPVVTDLGTAGPRAAELSSFQISSTDFFFGAEAMKSLCYSAGASTELVMKQQ